MPSPIDLKRTAIHLAPNGSLRPVEGFDLDYDGYMEQFCSPGSPGALAHVVHSDRDWPAWEVHPEGDELVFLLSGRASFYQDVGGRVERIDVGPGEGLVNPAGVPHTADVIEPFTALYLTPCPGTHHIPR